jgi:hypothetical protein
LDVIARAGLGQRGDDAKAAGVGHGAGHIGRTHALHPALDDRVFDFEHFGDARLEGHRIFPRIGL